MKQPITLYSFSFRHHGKFSSFHRLLHYAANCHTIDATYPLRSVAGVKGTRRLEGWWQAASEWRLKPVYARTQRQCVHYLYPENSLIRGSDWKGGHKLIMSCHQPSSSLPETRGFTKGLQVADRIVVLASHFMADYAPFCAPEKLRMIPHGVDIHFFSPKPAAPTKGWTILTIGNWLRDYDFWAEVVSKVAPDLPELRFIVVALPQKLEEIRSKMNDRLRNRVSFLYGLSDLELRDLYHQSDLLFLPLKDAGANNALLETMACGVPALVTDLPATREYAGDCGTYFAPGNVNECVLRLKELLADGKRRFDLGQSSRQRAVENFAWELIARRYHGLYSEVLEQ